MEKVYTIETTGRADFCIGAFADLEKAKKHYEIAKTRVGKEEPPQSNSNLPTAYSW